MKLKGTTLTPEQTDAAKAIIEGNNIKIIAPAGAGKSLTLLAGARKLKGYGLNISFNKALAISASKSFPKNCLCKTGHSLAFASVGRKYSKRLTKITGHSLANSFDIGSPGHLKSPANKGYHILETIRAFCYSNDNEISQSHVPIPKIALTKQQYKQTIDNISYFANKVWSEMIKTSASIPITHDVYLKLFALSKPVLKKDFIFFDETQDANPVMLDIIQNQNAQLIFAGDPFQQIYSWRGAVNALGDSLDFEPYYISQSFRYGPAIADMANKIITSYSDPNLFHKPIKGNDKIKSEIHSFYQAPTDCIICRTNAGLINQLIRYQKDAKFKIHLIGGAQNLIRLINGIKALKEKKKAFHPDLMLFDTYNDLIEYTESPMGGDLKYLIKLIDSYGFGMLLKQLHMTTEDPSEANITLTTVHKAKGLEWPKVKLGNDFAYPNEDMLTIPQEEVNILYVAATRAINILDISGCDALKDKNLNFGVIAWQEKLSLEKD